MVIDRLFAHFSFSPEQSVVKEWLPNKVLFCTVLGVLTVAPVSCWYIVFPYHGFVFEYVN